MQLNFLPHWHTYMHKVIWVREGIRGRFEMVWGVGGRWVSIHCELKAWMKVIKLWHFRPGIRKGVGQGMNVFISVKEWYKTGSKPITWGGHPILRVWDNDIISVNNILSLPCCQWTWRPLNSLLKGPSPFYFFPISIWFSHPEIWQKCCHVHVCTLWWPFWSYKC